MLPIVNSLNSDYNSLSVPGYILETAFQILQSIGLTLVPTQLQLWLYGTTFILVIYGIHRLRVTYHRSRSWYTPARTPVLPLPYAHEGDDVWIRGRIECPEPLIIPSTDIQTCYYSCTTEKQKYSSEGIEQWSVTSEEERGTMFIVHDHNEHITVNAKHVMFYDLPTFTSYEKNGVRRTFYFLPLNVEVSIHGWVSEKKEFLLTHDHIQLIGTPLYPHHLIQLLRSDHKQYRVITHAIVWLGSFLFYVSLATLFHRGLQETHIDELLALSPIPLLASCLTMLLYWTVESFNTIVEYNMRAQNAWLMIDIDMKQRYQLIPQIQQIVKDAIEHEQKVFSLAATLRQELSTSINETIIAGEGQIHDSIRVLLFLDEAYPQLQGDEQFKAFRTALLSIEEKITQGRLYFNDCAQEYNILIQSLPHTIVAYLSGYESLSYFEQQEPYLSSEVSTSVDTRTPAP